jgi:3-oxoacyl-[acyl-carrier protein] reductase
MQLEGARILITGGATGIGRAIADMAAAGGARLAICGRREQLIEEAAAEIGAHGFACDVRDEGQVDALFKSSIQALGGLDVLVNNAAIGHRSPLLELEADRFREVFETNVLGAMLCGRAAARHFVEHGGGTILNVGSTAAGKGYAGGSAYASSKFALSALTECWRAELRPQHVRVMQVNPSEVQTPFGGRDTTRINATKLLADDVAHVVLSMLTMENRGFVTEATVWATNPQA